MQGERTREMEEKENEDGWREKERGKEKIRWIEHEGQSGYVDMAGEGETGKKGIRK